MPMNDSIRQSGKNLLIDKIRILKKEEIIAAQRAVAGSNLSKRNVALVLDMLGINHRVDLSD